MGQGSEIYLVFALGKGRNFTLNFLNIWVSSVYSNTEPAVTRHVPFRHAFVLTLPVSLLLILSIASLLFIFPWIAVSSLFLSQSVITMLEFNQLLRRVFLFPLIDHIFFLFWAIFIAVSFSNLFTEAFLLSIGVLKSWHCGGELSCKFSRLLHGSLVNPPLLCEVVFENFLKIFSSNNLVKMLFFALSSFRSWSVWSFSIQTF